MHSISRTGKAAFAAALIAGAVVAARPAAAQQDTAPDPTPAQTQRQGLAVGEIVTRVATVQKIDRANDQLTLKDAQGRTFEVKAGPAVDLDRLRVGDRVVANYYEEVALAIDRAAQGPPTMTERTIHHGGVTARQATVTARIVKVDTKRNEVVIRAPNAVLHTLKVKDPKLQHRLHRMKAGEAFDVTYTQAVALTIEPRRR